VSEEKIIENRSTNGEVIGEDEKKVDDAGRGDDARCL